MEQTLEEFIDKAAPVMMRSLRDAGANKECSELAISFLRIKYDRGELTNNLENDCRKCILESAIYLTNCEGKDPTK